MSTVPPFDSVSEFIHLLQASRSPFCGVESSAVPVVSIISSFFNAHRYFEETYQSVIQQTFQNFEWIIVDDCSTAPEAIALFNSLPQKSAKIKMLRHTLNQGLAAGRNTAIAHAQGKYLFFLDLDDLIDPTYIEKGVLFLETHPEFSLVNSYSVGFQAEEYWWSHGFDHPARFIEQNWVTGRLFYRKADFDQLGGFDENLRAYEDWERWLKALTYGQKGWTIPEYLDAYRRTETGMLATSLKNAERDVQRKQNIRDRYKLFFQTHTLQPVSLKRSRFDSQPLRKSFAVNNLLKRNVPKKQILCCFPHLEMGGADRFNLDFVTNLADRGYGFTIITTLTAHQVWHRYFYAITPDIFHLPNILDPIHWLAAIKYLITSRQIDIVWISNCYIAYYFLPFLRQEFPQTAFVDFTHTTDPDWRGNGYPRLSCQFAQFLDQQVVTSRFLVREYQKMGAIASNKLAICYTNIDPNVWQPDNQKRQQMRTQLNISDETVVLLYPARFVEQKRPLFLVDIIQALLLETSNIKVICLGDGHLRSPLQTKVNEAGVSANVQILDPAPPTEMLDFYAAADILILPSAYEGISLAIYEAMAMALPIVASAVGGQAELVTPATGYLMPLGQADNAEIQAYVDVLLPLIQDSSLRQRFGKNARQRIVDSFTLDRMGDRLETILQEAIAKRQSVIGLADSKKDNVIAEEMLLMTLEYLHQEQTANKLWQENQQLKAERHELAWQKKAMETSKFWQLRRQWFKLKQFFRLTDLADEKIL